MYNGVQSARFSGPFRFGAHGASANLQRTYLPPGQRSRWRELSYLPTPRQKAASARSPRAYSDTYRKAFLPSEGRQLYVHQGVDLVEFYLE